MFLERYSTSIHPMWDVCISNDQRNRAKPFSISSIFIIADFPGERILIPEYAPFSGEGGGREND